MAPRADQVVVGISLKMYLSWARTRQWARDLRATVEASNTNADVFVLPDFTSIASVAEVLSGSTIAWGAQDVASTAAGAQTGEVGAAVLAELGCRYVEVGHAERRRLFGENHETIADKTAQALSHGLIPIVCVGESDRVPATTAAEVCAEQLDACRINDFEEAVVIAYEPVWAIGANEPAPPEHVLEVCALLRRHTSTRSGRTRILYGGSAGPGTFATLTPTVDGLFLGRSAHDVANVAAVLREISEHAGAGAGRER